jgi:O-antigen biosynthesis protein WbqV
MVTLPRSFARIALNVVVDGTLAGLAVPAARWVADPSLGGIGPVWAMPAGSLCVLLAGVPFRLSLQYWRFAGLRDLLGVAATASVAALLLSFVGRSVGGAWPSESYPLVLALTLLLLLGGPRVIYRHLHANRAAAPERSAAQPVLLIGAGEAADLFIRALMADRQPAYRVVGLLTLAARQTGRRIHGCPILGTLDGSAAVLERLRHEGRLPALLVVTTPELTGPALARLLEESDRLGLQVRRAPRPTALAPASEILALKPVAIEDLLNRAQIPLDREGMARLVQGRRVLVTGAGGTIGSELARQVAALGPEKLTLLDNGEYALWQIDLELAETHPAVARAAVIADIRDEARVRTVFDQVRPDLVFHAAALKHVPMVEANPLEGLLSNVVGSRHVADAARAVGTQAMVLISTDKAVNPTSVMGASKRLAEMYCQALDIVALDAGAGMRCITVRFGNVLGSTGSVVPLFRRQLERGGPLTVTHPDMQRYFMTVREAVGLVLEACVVGLGAKLGEDGGIFVLDMGKPVKIVDLARQMIRLAGLRPEQDVEIRFTGLRPGEKLYEELFHGREPPTPTGHEGLLMATPRTADPAIVGRAIEEIAAACRIGQARVALTTLGRMVPEFEHNVDGSAGAARLG